uniref:Tc1-like transposase DDE domain-containing protein n=1 Tax=Phytophthora ramorum TaxID=164328 RepID=H3GJC8_PHYRM
MTVEVITKLEEYLDEQADTTMVVMKDRLLSDMSVDVSITSIHRALHGMLYTVKGLRIEKAAINNAVNKEKRMAFTKAFNAHVAAGYMVVYHDETNFNIYLSRNQGWARVGERTVVTLPASKGKNLHVQCGVSPGNGLVLLRTHDGSVRMEENARSVADLFVAALNSDEYKECCVGKKVVVITDNSSAHSQVETMAREQLVTDGIVNSNKLVILRLALYSPMCNAIEGCFSVLKARMKLHLAAKWGELLVRGQYNSLTANRMALMKEAVESSKEVLTLRLVWHMERHCFKSIFLAERGEDMELGK